MGVAHLRTARASVFRALQPMMAKATRDGLLFYNEWQNLYLTPAELMTQMEQGRYIWGPECWQLRPPIPR